MSEIPTSDSVRLYRIENPLIASEPDDLTSHKDLKGQWFTPDLQTAIGYLRKSTQTFGKGAGPVDGARLVVADVPAGELDKLHVSQNQITRDMDVENNNYIVPRDGTIPTREIPLDDVIGDLRGSLGNFHKLKEARERISALFDEPLS